MTQFGDDHVHAACGQGDVLDLALQELDVGQPGLPGVAAGEGKHLVGHVESVDPAGRTHPPGREDDVDPTAGAEIEHDLALLEGGDRQRVAASERGKDRGLGQIAQLLHAVVAWPEAGVCRRPHRHRTDPPQQSSSGPSAAMIASSAYLVGPPPSFASVSSTVAPVVFLSVIYSRAPLMIRRLRRRPSNSQ